MITDQYQDELSSTLSPAEGVTLTVDNVYEVIDWITERGGNAWIDNTDPSTSGEGRGLVFDVSRSSPLKSSLLGERRSLCLCCPGYVFLAPSYTGAGVIHFAPGQIEKCNWTKIQNTQPSSGP
jgi:hypothetical protein